ADRGGGASDPGDILLSVATYPAIASRESNGRRYPGARRTSAYEAMVVSRICDRFIPDLYSAAVLLHFYQSLPQRARCGKRSSEDVVWPNVRDHFHAPDAAFLCATGH